MDKAKSISNFEILLNQYKTKQPSGLYINTLQNPPVGSSRDILTSLSSQIRAIQAADKKEFSTKPKKLSSVKASEFVPLSQLLSNDVVQQPKSSIVNRFETQCCTDTELISIVEKVEILNSNIGITQEFQSTCHFNSSKNDGSETSHNFTQHGAVGNEINDTLKATSDLFENSSSFVSNNLISEIRNTELVKETTSAKEHLDKDESNDSFIDINCTQIFNEALQIESNIHHSVENQDIALSPLPESNSTTEPKRPLVFDLEAFEAFEKIALQRIEQNDTIINLKTLINSQVDDKEIPFSANIEPLIHKYSKIKSPIISPILQCKTNIDKDELKKVLASVPFNNLGQEFDDEILFSSDEESNANKLQDIPLTCVLETSFYDQPDILDKTMYVAFQTANNNAIQINTESFINAKSLMTEHIDHEPTLNDLVKKFDNNIPSATNSKTLEYCDFNGDVHTEVRQISDVFKYNITEPDIFNTPSGTNDNDFKKSEIESAKEQNITKNSPRKGSTCIVNDVQINTNEFVGFKTASNKKITVSEKALAACKKVLQDFELDTENNNSNTHTDKAITKDVSSIEQDMLEINKDGFHNEFQNNDTFFEDISKHEDTKFVGFQTASNKIIKISDEALKKSKVILQQIDNNKKETKNEVAIERVDVYTYKFAGFTTASNKAIKISDAAVAKTKNFFNDSLENIAENKTKPEIIKFEANAIDSKDIQSCRFKTASNKNIEVSEVCLAKTKHIFSNLGVEEDFETNLDSERALEAKESFSKEKPFVGFKTASDKIITVSECALAKTTNIFDGLDEVIEPRQTDTASKTNANYETVNHEYKHSNKLLANTDNALDKSQFNKIYQHKLLGSGCKDLDDFERREKDLDLPFQGFKTASNKLIKISAEAIAKSKQFLADTDNSKENTVKSEDIRKKEKEDFSVFVGFQTARDKPVKISHNALEHSKKVLGDWNLDNVVNENVTFCEYPKANYKTLEISDKALSKTEDELKDILMCTDNNGININTFSRFQTANNKQVTVSKEAIARSKKLFNEFYAHNDENEVQTKIIGFHTANNKKITISEDSLAKTRNLFNDIDNVKLEAELTNTDMHSKFHKKASDINELKSKEFTFKTGQNNDIKVTAAALDISKKLRKQSKLITDDKSQTNIEGIMNTQVFNNFEKTLCTEDFKIETPERSKRSGSPILSCPKAKKRMVFQTPYKIDSYKQKGEILPKIVVAIHDYSFKENYKKTHRYNLKDLVDIDQEGDIKIDPYVLSFNFEDLLNFKFKDERNDLTESELSIPELKTFFLNIVNKKIVPDGWLDNHLKLVLWKLISYEIKFPNAMRNCCTVKNVIDQLKYRYDRDLYNVERPALRKIYEKDEPSTKTIVLCVVNILVDCVNVKNPSTTDNIELLVTDGWYCIKACIDKMLRKLVCDKKIVVGSKIVTQGAELLNNDNGIAPWEDTSSVRLKLFGNSTRRARWDARLGFNGHVAILTPLSAVKPEGGKVSKLRLFVTRLYPALYVEKFEDGSTVTRSDRLEQLYQSKFESDRQIALEKIYEEVEKEYSDLDSQDSEGYDLTDKTRSLNSGSPIAKMMKKCKDPSEFRATLTFSQTKMLHEYSSRKRDKLLQEIQKQVESKINKNGVNLNRNVVSLLKIRVAGIEEDKLKVTKGMMSIWKPNEAITEIVKEGAWIEVLNVLPTAVRNSEIQLTAGRQTKFSVSKLKQKEKSIILASLLRRKCYEIGVLSKNPSISVDYNEIDTYGFVFLIEPSPKEFESIKNQMFQNVYMSDAEKNIICVNFWGGLKKFGYENVLDTGQIVACMNLQKRAGNTKKNIPQFRATELTLFTKTPKNTDICNNLEELSKKMYGIDRRKFCEDCVAIKNNYTAIKLKNNSEYVSPYRINKCDYNTSINKQSIKPSNNKCDFNFNLTGLDFETSFNRKDTQELSPNSLKRKRKVNEKIEKLEMYGEPPPLAPMYIINKSRNANSLYKSPLAETSIDSNKIMSDANPQYSKLRESYHVPLSPVTTKHTTYIKHSNPVKLNFSNSVAIDENPKVEVDPFAEDFDASPPLSLDSNC